MNFLAYFWQKFKCPKGAQRVILLMGEASNYFSVDVRKEGKTATEKRKNYLASREKWRWATVRAIAL